MNKKSSIAIILDSISGLSAKVLAEHGFEYIYQQVFLDNKAYADGIDLNLAKDKDKIFSAKDFKTSLPPINVIQETFARLAPKYDFVVYLPMNKNISGTYATAAAVAKDYPNVYVVENNLLTSGLISAANTLRTDVQNGMPLEKALLKVKTTSDATQIFLAPQSIERLIKSGRLTGVKKLFLEKARIIPLINLTNNGFELSGMKRSQERSLNSAVRKMIEQIGQESLNQYQFEIVHCGDETARNLALRVYQEHGINDVAQVWTCTAVAGHVGEAAVALHAYPKPSTTN